jgi:hypothetical protein
MSTTTKPNNRHKKRNSPRVPLILMALVGGTLISLKWVHQVRAKHEELALESQQRMLVSEIDQLKLDIINQEGRIKELAVRDVVLRELPRHGIRMLDVLKNSVITLPARDKKTSTAASKL